MRSSLGLAPGLGLATMLAACAGSGAGGCGPRPLAVANLSAVAVEQLYFGSGAPEGWGADLLGQAGLPSGTNAAVTVPERGAAAVRVVWRDGRAVELGGINACRIGRVTVLDAALRAE